MSFFRFLAGVAANLEERLDGKTVSDVYSTGNDRLIQWEESLGGRAILNARLQQLSGFSSSLLETGLWRGKLPPWVCLFQQVLHYSETPHFLAPFWSYFHENIAKLPLSFTPSGILSLQKVLKQRFEHILGPLLQRESMMLFALNPFGQHSPLKEFSKNGLKAFARDYPVAVRLLSETTLFLIEALKDFSQHFLTDRLILKEVFGCEGEIEDIVFLGDSHKKGKNVIRITLGGREVVYKPRNLDLEANYFSFIDCLPFPLKKLQIISKGHYGWMEYVNPSTNSFHSYSIGVLIAILFVFNGSDFHYENLIHSDDGLIPIDLEMLIHPPLQEFFSYNAAECFFSHNSLLGLGLLPMWVGKRGKEVNMGGLSSWISSPEFSHAAIDECLEGFSNAYHFLCSQRQQLPWHLFASSEARWLAQSTQKYGLILQEALSPSALKDGLTRSFALDKLFTFYYHSHFADSLDHQHVFQEELLQLEQGDVPFFSCDIHSKALTLPLKKQNLENFFPITGWEKLQKRIKILSHEDLAIQKRWISKSLSLHLPKSPIVIQSNQLISFNKDQCLDLIFSIEKCLLDQAFDEKGILSWIGTLPMPGNIFGLQPLGTDLFEGTSGIALFLAALYFVDPTPERHMRASNLFQVLLKMQKSSQAWYYHLDKFRIQQGTAGLSLALARASHWLQEPHLLQEAIEIAKKTFLATKETNIDLLSGLAGGILVLTELLRYSYDQELISILSAAVRTLIEWLPTKNLKLGSDSYLNGKAGIAYALSSAYFFLKDPNLLKVINLSFEKQHQMDIPLLSTCFLLNKTKLSGKKVIHQLTQDLWNPIDRCCWGNAGILDAAYTIACREKNTEQIQHVQDSIASFLFQTKKRGYFVCTGSESFQNHSPPLGLYQGISGIGYVLLRCIRPELESFLFPLIL